MHFLQPFMLANSEVYRKRLYKHKLHQNHIQYRSARDGQERLAFPEVQPRCDGDGDQLRQAVAAGDEGNIAHAIDDQHGKRCAGQHGSEVLNEFRRGTFGAEHREGQKAHQHGAQRAHGDGDDLLRDRHCTFTSNGFLSAVSAHRMQIIVGIRK